MKRYRYLFLFILGILVFTIPPIKAEDYKLIENNGFLEFNQPLPQYKYYHISPDGSNLIILSEDNKIMKWNLQSGALISEQQLTVSNIDIAGISDQGNYYFTYLKNSFNYVINIYNLHDTTPFLTFNTSDICDSFYFPYYSIGEIAINFNEDNGLISTITNFTYNQYAGQYYYRSAKFETFLLQGNSTVKSYLIGDKGHCLTYNFYPNGNYLASEDAYSSSDTHFSSSSTTLHYVSYYNFSTNKLLTPFYNVYSNSDGNIMGRELISQINPTINPSQTKIAYNVRLSGSDTTFYIYDIAKDSTNKYRNINFYSSMIFVDDNHIIGFDNIRVSQDSSFYRLSYLNTDNLSIYKSFNIPSSVNGEHNLIPNTNRILFKSNDGNFRILDLDSSTFIEKVTFSVSANVHDLDGNAFTFTPEIDLAYDSLLWEFGDGIKSIAQQPTHSYSKTGLYDIKLTVFTSDSVYVNTKQEYILITPYPKANFSLDQIKFAVPHLITVKNLSSDSPDSAFWYLNNKLVSTDYDLSYNFTEAGSYHLKLVVKKGKYSDSLEQILPFIALPEKYSPKEFFNETILSSLNPNSAFDNIQKPLTISNAFELDNGNTFITFNGGHYLTDSLGFPIPNSYYYLPYTDIFRVGNNYIGCNYYYKWEPPIILHSYITYDTIPTNIENNGMVTASTEYGYSTFSLHSKSVFVLKANTNYKLYEYKNSIWSNPLSINSFSDNLYEFIQNSDSDEFYLLGWNKDSMYIFNINSDFKIANSLHLPIKQNSTNAFAKIYKTDANDIFFFVVNDDTLTNYRANNLGSLETISSTKLYFKPYNAIVNNHKTILIANEPTGLSFTEYNLEDTNNNLSKTILLNRNVEFKNYFKTSDGGYFLYGAVNITKDTSIQQLPYYLKISPNAINNLFGIVLRNDSLKAKSTAYPNPTNTTLNILLNSINGENVKIDAYDISGKVLKTIYDGTSSSNLMNLVIDINYLKQSSGTIYLNITKQSGNETIPIIIDK